LRVEAYFRQVRDTIEACSFLQLSTVTYDKRGTHEGFIRGELGFVDGSVLYLLEFVDVQTAMDRLMYAYQYTDASGNLIFRYDNTGHHKKLNLPTYPHHKHEGSEDNVVASPAPDLVAVLGEIETLVQLR
jgi:hypothetical protein